MFSHDTTLSLQAAAALVNTGRMRDGVDRLETAAELDAFYVAHGYEGHGPHDEDDVIAVRHTRDGVARLWEVERDEAVALVNSWLLEGDARPQLVRHGDWDWHLHAHAPDATLAVQISVETAMALIDVVRSGAFDRLRACEGEGCSAVLVDLSRNSSRRFCDVNNCGNRAHVEAYRARQAAQD
ncbi:RNA-binding protein [Serinibacter arcticus]|uniref:RNA-binding protein n=1 Tax=Serinibacter arcticus TaxID=1655435 RepID=A0A2U1ZSX8_9MICO|nr:CGNR zinc finger domain-containing protein [Serinibacter arcticus]PWD50088.1 RNA-binding protein [Serinibacter arcticus]